MAGTISFSGLSASGIDTSGWVDALVSVKQQTVTSLEREKEAKESLLSVVNNIKSYFSSFQSCLQKITDSQYGIASMDLFMQNLAISSNVNIATATATTEAARQSYDVAVDSLATTTKATSGYSQYEVRYATYDTRLGLLGAKNGTITVNSQSFNITVDDTISTLISKFKNVGVDAEFDEKKGAFTIGVSVDEIDEGNTNIKRALKLQDNAVDGATSGSLVYVTRDTEFSKLGLTGGKLMIEGAEHTITQNGDNYTIQKAGEAAVDMNTLGDFLDYLKSAAVNAEDASVDNKGNITIKGATLDKVEGGSNLIDILNLIESAKRTVSESDKLSYIEVHAADLNTKLSALGINADTTLTAGGVTHTITNDKTLGDIQNLLKDAGVDFNVSDKGVIVVNTNGNEISGTLLDVLNLDPSKGGTTITSTEHQAKFNADGSTLLSDLGINDSYKYTAYKSDGTAVTQEVSNLSGKTIDELVADLKAAGLDASFDKKLHQLVIKDGYIEGTLADALGMSEKTTTYTESATLNTKLEKLGATGNQTLTIDGGAQKTYSKDVTLDTVLNDIKDAGGKVEFKDGNITITGVTLGGTLPVLLGLDATTQGTSVSSGKLTVVTDTGSSGGNNDATVEHDIDLNTKIGDITGTTGDYTLAVDKGTSTTYSKNTTLQTLKNQIEGAGGKFTINDDNTISIEDVTLSGTLVGALGFDEVATGTRFSTVNAVMVQGTSNIANGGTSLGNLGIVSGATRMMARAAAAPAAGINGATLSIDGGAEITYNSTTTLDDIFADIRAAGGTASIDADGYILIDGVHLEGSLVGALGLVETSERTTITSGDLKVTTETSSTSSSTLFGSDKGDISWDSTIGSITNDTNSYNLSLNGVDTIYGTDTKLSDIKTAVENAGGVMTINSDNTISIKGVELGGTLVSKLGFTVDQIHTIVSSNDPIYYQGSDVVADTGTKFSQLGVADNLRDYAIYMNDGTIVKASSTDGTAGDKTIGDWLKIINDQLNAANGTTGSVYASINNGVISITGGYVTGSLATALGIGTKTTVTGITMEGTSVSYVDSDPLKYIGVINRGDGYASSDVTNNGSISNSINQAGTAAGNAASNGWMIGTSHYQDLWGNVTEATLNATLKELLDPSVSDPLDTDARLTASSYTLKIGSYAEKTFDSATTTLQDVINYVDNLKQYDSTYDIAFDAYLYNGKLIIKSDAEVTGTLADVIGLTKTATEDEYYTYTAKNVKYTDLIEGASNGFNFSIVGDKVIYDKTETGSRDGYEYTGDKIQNPAKVEGSPEGFIKNPSIQGGSSSGINVSPDGFIETPTIHNDTITTQISTYPSMYEAIADTLGSDMVGKVIRVTYTVVGALNSDGTAQAPTERTDSITITARTTYQEIHDLITGKNRPAGAEATLTDAGYDSATGILNIGGASGSFIDALSQYKTSGLEYQLPKCGGTTTVALSVDAIVTKTYVFSLTDFVSGETYYIKDVEDLNKLASLVNGGKNTEGVTFILENDIDMSSILKFAGIGNNVTSDAKFRGTFYGNGYVIKNLRVSSSGASGLFGAVDGATITDLGLENVNITADDYAGALIGNASGITIINNVYVKGGSISISSDESNESVGGLVGYFSGDRINISKSYADVTVTATGVANAGGLVGFIGSSTSLISHSFALGNVSSNGGYTGGLVGTMGPSSKVEHSYASGNVTGGTDSDGLVGYFSGETIKTSYATGQVNGADSITLYNSSGNAVTGKTLADLQTQATMEGLGFTSENGWKYTAGVTPHFGNVTVTSGTSEKVYVSSLTDFVSGNTYYIKNSDDLNKLAELTNAGKNTTGVTFILENDIDMSGVSNFAGIGGKSTNSFKGTFYGNGHVIENLTMNIDSDSWFGLFGYTSGATIKDIALKNVNITNTNGGGGTYTGGLVGYATDSTIENAYVSGGSITSKSMATGGLIGGIKGTTTIKNAYADITINVNVSNDSSSGGYAVGGLVGEMNDNSKIELSFATGDITGAAYQVGGLVGRSLSSDNKINNAYSTVNVSSTRNNAIAGGLIGSNMATVINTYATGTVSGVTAGGLIGENNGTVNYGIYNSDSNSKGVGTGSTTSVTGSTLAELTSDRWNNVLASADGWEYTTGVGMTFGNYITTTTGGGAVTTATTIGELFGGDTASRTLGVKLDGGTAKDLTFASTDSIQTVIDKLAAEGITASLTAEGKFKVASEKQYILSGDLAKKLFGGDGNKLYTYSGTKVTYTTGSSSVEFDGFIKNPETHTGGSSGSSVTNDGFINNPTIQGGGSSSSTVDYDGFIKNPTIHSGGATTGTTVTYTRGAVTLPTTSTSISSNTKLVDLFGSAVIGTTIIQTTNACSAGGLEAQPDLGIGSGSSSGPNGNVGSITHMHMAANKTSTITIDANTTLADLGGLYNSSTGVIKFQEDSYSDCSCQNTVRGTFWGKIGISPTIKDESSTTQKLTRTVTTYKIPNAITTGGGGNASTSTTMKELFNNTSSHTFSVVWDDGSTGSTFTLSSTDTIQTLFDKLATIGITASIDSSGKFTYVSSKDWRATGDLGEKIGSDPFYTISGNALTTKSSTTTTIHPVTTKISSFNSSAVGTRIWVKSDQYTGSTTGYIAQNANFRYLDINANTTIQDIVNLYNSIGGTAHYDTLTGEVVVELQRGYSLSVGNGFPYSRPNLQVGTESEGGTYKIMMGGNSIINNGTPAEETTKMNEIFGAFIGSKEFTLTNNGQNHTISFTGNDTIADLVDKLNATGVSATFSKALLASRINVESRHSDFEIGVNETSKKLFGYASPDGADYIVSKVPDIGHTATYSGGSTSKVYVSSLTDFKSGDTYYIKNSDDLNKLAELTNAGKDTTNVSFILENDIDMASVANFTPIGTLDLAFKGNFYGNGHTIKNLTIDTSEPDAALFGCIKNATIKDLLLTNVNIKSTYLTTGATGFGGSAAALTATAYDSIIDNVGVSGGTLDATYVGGLVDYLSGSTVTNSYASVDIIVHDGAYHGEGSAGGLVDEMNNSTINHSFATGTIVGTGGYAGGLVGNSNDLTVTTSTISNSYAAVDITLTSGSSLGARVGGILGWTNAGSNGSIKGLIIENNYTIGLINVTGNQTYVGALIGAGTQVNSANSGYKIVNNIYNSDIGLSGTGEGDIEGTIGKTLAEMQTQSVMEGLGFTAANGWKYTTGATPHFGNVTVTSGPPQKVYVSSLTDFVAGDTYYIKTAADLNKLAELTNAGKNTSGVSFILENDIDMASAINFTPIGTVGNTFKGTFYGNGHVIDNLTINRISGYVGLFGAAEGATIKDLGLENVQIGGGGTGIGVGALVGNGSNVTISNVYVKGGTVSSTSVNGGVGGLVGFAASGLNISDSYADVTVTSEGGNTGGLVGQAGTNAIINRSYASGNVTSKGAFVGGLIGNGTSTQINNSYAIGNVTGSSNTGSLVGMTGSTIKTSYSTGQVNGADSITLYNSSGTAVTGKTLAEMQTQSVMEGLGFTSANGWKYTTGATPNFGNVTITSGGDTNKVYVSSLTDFVAGDTYYIKTAADLNKLAELTNAGKVTKNVTFILENDIDMSSVANFEVIGADNGSEQTFCGTFYGNGHVIKNLTVSGRTSGLFGSVHGATIADLGLENVNITGEFDVGALIGICYADAATTTVSNVYVKGGSVSSTVNHGAYSVGGLIGSIRSSINISNAYSDVTVTATGGSNAGGLVGQIASGSSVISHSFTMGDVSSNGGDVGGLVGSMGANTKIEHSFSIGNVTGGTNSNGLVGSFSGNSIKTSYSTGQVNGADSITLYNSSGTAVTGKTLADLKTQTTMQGLGFTDANGWKYTSGVTPHFGNVTVTDTTQTHTASNSTTMGQLFGDTASHTLTVDGTNITIATSDTVSNVFEKLAEKGIMASMENGVISIESSGAHTLTGDVTQKLFGASTVTLTTNSPAGTYTLYKVAGTGDVTTTYTMDVNTKIGDLFGDTNNHTFTINGEDITLGADKTIQDLINALAAKGYTVSVTDGKMTIGSNGNSSFTVSGDLADKVLKKTGTVESDYKTQEVTLSTGSKMKDIFWDNDAHDFVINKADGTKVTISLSANDNIQTLIDKLKQNGVAATIDSNGKMTFKSNYQWSASGDLGDLITGGVEMSKVTTPLYTFTSDDVNMYTGVQYVSDMTELVAGNKYHIKTAADLVALANFIKNGADTTGTRFYLDNDIDMSSVANFTAIGTSANKFKGTVYGNGYTVKNLKVDTTELCAGLFGFIENATIQDLGITDADIKGTAYAGILVGKADNSTIKNVYSTGKVTATADQIGGLIGDLNGESSIAQNIYSTAEVLGKVNVGGLIGYLGNNAVLENAYATGDVNSSEHNVGGLVGAMRYGGTVKNAYATGNIEAGSGMHIGGLIGLIESNGGGSYVIDTVYSTGRVHGGTNVGGLIGYRLSTNVTVTNGVFNSNLEISGVGNGSTAGIVGKTYVEMQNASVMQGLGFTTAKGWKYVDKYTPILNSVSVSGGGKVYVNGLTEFRAGDTYYIASKEDLNRLAELVNMGEDTTGTTFILDADINMSGVDFAGIGKLVNTGGTNTYSSEYVFKGDFYGNGHVISNLTTDQGLFTATQGAIIRDVGLENVKIESTNEQYAGALIGMALATTVTNSYVKGGTVTVTRNDGQVAIVGGLVGALCTGSISESYSDVVVTADGGSTSKMYAGGFIGGFSNISFSAGTIVENNITKSYATGDVIANGKIVGAGGFLGFANAGDMNITTSFSTGNIYSSGEAEQKYLGGFVAFVGGSLGNTKTLNIVNSYSSSSVDHSGSAGGFIGEITDKGVVNVSGGAVYNKSTELSAIGSGTLTSGSVVGMLMTDMIKQDKMEAQGFTADKGWKYFADTTPVLNANVTVSETGGKRYVSGVEEFRSGDTYYISTAADLQKLSTLVNSGQITDGVKFVLENDIDMSSIANFTSIGTDTNSFNGEFVGNGFIISNLKVDVGSDKDAGLFGYIENASIRDVAVENANVKSTGGNFVGILVGEAKNSVIQNVYATGTVSGYCYVGGLIGMIDDNTTVSDSYANANVTAVSTVGGLIGLSGGDINNSFASGTVRVTGTEGRAGGLVGQLNGGSIKTSYSDASVSGTREIGGLVGRDNHNATISNSYAIGSVSGTIQVGAFIGNSQGRSTLTGNISNSTSSATAIGTGSRTGVTSLTIDKIQDKATMESYGFTSDLGWVYYEGKAPMLQQKDTSTQHQEKITLDTILSNIGNNSISKDITVTVNGNTTSKIFDDNTTVGEVIDWLNGIADINASFDSTNSKLTISADYGDLKVEGGLANMLFGDRTTITKDEITENTDSSNLFAQGNKEKITGNTTVGQLMGMTTGSASIGYKDDTGKVIMKSFGVDQTLNDVIAYLNSQGFTAKIENGVFTAEKDGAAATDILGALGNKLKGDSATVVTNPSGYTSGELASTNSSKATANTKLSQLGIDSGRIYVQDASGNVLETIQINNEMTINDAAQLLANYGFTLSINDGKVTVKGEGTNKLVDGTSNMVSKMKLDNWIETKDTLKNNSTVAQMGFSDGAVLGLIVNGKSYNLAFDADDTLNDIISTLGTYGITASVDANGKFTASGDGTFVLTNELGAYLTQNSVEGYVTEGDGYKSDKPLEFDKDEVLLTEDTTIGELLGTGQGGILRLTLDENTVIDLEYEANETMRDVMTDLAGYGITAKIKDGVLTAVSTDKTFTFAGDVGKAMSGKTPQYEELGTGYLSKDLSYKTTGAATMNSTLKEMGISSGQIHILSNDGKIVSTLDVDGSFTAAQIKSMLQPYGMTMTMDANGKVSITSAEGYKLSDGTSNMVSKWGLNNWNDVTETLSATTTIGQMGFKDGADLNLFIDGAVMNILSFDADETLQDVIFALSAYGIDASVDANGMFTAVSKSHTFVMSSSLGSFLTKGTAGYVNSDTGYQTYKPLEEEHPYVVNSSGSLGYEKLMTETSTLASLGFEQGGTVRVMLDGTTPYTLEFLATDTVQDVIYALSAYGINAEVKDGKFVAESIDNQFTITGNFGSFLMSGGAYDNEITGYESAPITFETVEKLTEDTKLSDLGILRGDVNIIKDGKLTGSTINITDDTTLGQLFNAIKVYGMTGSIVTDAAGNTSVRISADSNVKLADGTSNVVSGLGLTEIRQGDFEGNKVYWDDDATEGLITKDMLLSSFDRDGFIAEGSLIFETGAGDEAVEHIINISAGETVESLLNKFNDSGIKAELDNGVIKLSAGLDELTFTGGTSGLVKTIGLDIENVDTYASSAAPLTYEGEVHYSAANFADADTKLGIVNATNGTMSMFIDGIKVSIEINNEESFADLFQQIKDKVNAKTGMTIEAGFLGKDGTISSNPDPANNTGIVAFSIGEGHELVIGASNDTTNFATIANLNKTGYNSVTGSRALYKVNVNSRITESGLYRDGDITEGTFTIGDAEFTIDSNTTLSSLIDQINKSQTAYASAYWDTLSGTFVIESTITGASLINIEAGTSNFTDIMGFTTVKDGEGALVTDSQKLGQNAVVRINGTTVTSSSNVITSDISKIKGLTINLKNVSAGETVTINVEQDKEGIYEAVSDTVDAYNAMMEALGKELADRSSLGGESILKLMRNNLKRLMTSSLTGAHVFKNLASVGISTGEAQDSISTNVTSLLIDKDKFMDALASDSDAVQELLVGTQTNPGIFLQANTIVESSIKADGYFSNMADSLTRSINNIDKKISRTNDAIENYRAKLERQFHNMELTISGMQNSYANFLK